MTALRLGGGAWSTSDPDFGQLQNTSLLFNEENAYMSTFGGGQHTNNFEHPMPLAQSTGFSPSEPGLSASFVPPKPHSREGTQGMAEYPSQYFTNSIYSGRNYKSQTYAAEEIFVPAQATVFSAFVDPAYTGHGHYAHRSVHVPSSNSGNVNRRRPKQCPQQQQYQQQQYQRRMATSAMSDAVYTGRALPTSYSSAHSTMAPHSFDQHRNGSTRNHQTHYRPQYRATMLQQHSGQFIPSRFSQEPQIMQRFLHETLPTAPYSASDDLAANTNIDRLFEENSKFMFETPADLDCSALDSGQTTRIASSDSSVVASSYGVHSMISHAATSTTTNTSTITSLSGSLSTSGANSPYATARSSPLTIGGESDVNQDHANAFESVILDADHDNVDALLNWAAFKQLCITPPLPHQNILSNCGGSSPTVARSRKNSHSCA